MQSLTNFPAFTNFPKELQERVWEEFILDTTKNRIVLLSSERHVIPTRFLTSPSQCVNSVSREVFIRLFPTRLPVFRAFKNATFLSGNDDDDDNGHDAEEEGSDSDFHFDSEDENGDDSANLPRGYLYFNLDRDIFLVAGLRYFESTLAQRSHLREYKVSAHYKTDPLSLEQCNSLKNLMEIVNIHFHRYLNNGRPVPKIRRLALLNRHNYKKETFGGAETCRHVFWYIEHYRHLMSQPGDKFLELWEDETVLYNKEMLDLDEAA